MISNTILQRIIVVFILTVTSNMVFATPALSLKPMSKKAMSGVTGQAGIDISADLAFQVREVNINDGTEGTLRLDDVFYGDVEGGIGTRGLSQFGSSNALTILTDNTEGLEVNFGSVNTPRLGFEVRDIFPGDPNGNSIGSLRIGGIEVEGTQLDITGINDGLQIDGTVNGTIDSIDLKDPDGASCPSCSGSAGVLHIGKPGNTPSDGQGIEISDGSGNLGLGDGLTLEVDDQAGLVLGFPNREFSYFIKEVSVSPSVTGTGSSFGPSFGQLEIGNVEASRTTIELSGQGSGNEGLVGGFSAGITGDYLEIKDPNGAPDGSGNPGAIRFGVREGSGNTDGFIIDETGGTASDAPSRFTGLELDIDNNATINGNTQGALVLSIPTDGCGGNACPDVGIENIFLGNPSGGSIGGFDAENASFDGSTLKIGAMP